MYALIFQLACSELQACHLFLFYDDIIPQKVIPRFKVICGGPQKRK